MVVHREGTTIGGGICAVTPFDRRPEPRDIVRDRPRKSIRNRTLVSSGCLARLTDHRIQFANRRLCPAGSNQLLGRRCCWFPLQFRFSSPSSSASICSHQRNPVGRNLGPSSADTCHRATSCLVTHPARFPMPNFDPCQEFRLRQLQDQFDGGPDQ